MRCPSSTARTGRESVASVAEAALAEGEDLRWPHGEDVGDAFATGVAEPIGDRLELPGAVPLSSPGARELAEPRLVCHALGLALDDHVEAVLPAVAARRQRHPRVAFEVDG